MCFHRIVSVYLLIGSFLVANTLTPGSAASAKTIFAEIEKVASGSDGASPLGGLVFDAAGRLYGTTAGGGGSACSTPVQFIGCGTVFQLTPPPVPGGSWTETVIYSFGGADGANPFGTLAFDKSGALYGTTAYGGAFGLGTVFRLAPPRGTDTAWSLKTLHSFAGGDEGANPLGTVILDKSGAVLGTTSYGGSTANCGGPVGGCGTVFRLARPAAAGGAWSLHILHSFSGPDGALPVGGVALDQTRALVGTTPYGGSSTDCGGPVAGCGVAFRLVRPQAAGGAWSETVLHSFSGSDGAVPGSGLVFDSAGAAYGTTVAGGTANDCGDAAPGCGTVFRLMPAADPSGPWAETVLWRFGGGSDGSAPGFGGVVLDQAGSLYGTTVGGGSSSDCGGPAPGCGTVFRLMPGTGAAGGFDETVLTRFAGGSDGAAPFGSLIFDGDGALYGTTTGGGGGTCGTPISVSCGTVFQLAPAIGKELVLYRFGGP